MRVWVGREVLVRASDVVVAVVESAVVEEGIRHRGHDVGHQGQEGWMESLQIVIQAVPAVSDTFDCVTILRGEDEKAAGDGNNLSSVRKRDPVLIRLIRLHNFKVWFRDRRRVDGDIALD